MGHAYAVRIDGGNGRIQATPRLSLSVYINEYRTREKHVWRTLLGEPDGEGPAEWVEDPDGFREEAPDIRSRLYAK